MQMPLLSAGFMRCMHSWQKVSRRDIPVSSQENIAAIVQRALELGINHFETARGYGSSESQLGEVLQSVPRDSFLLQTKIQPTDDPADFRIDFEKSLGDIGLDRVDLLAIHGINDHHSLWKVCRPGGCLDTARQLQQEGLVGHVGFSGHGSAEVLLEAVRYEGGGGFDYLNLHWYYIYQVNSPVLAEAAARDMGVFIISPTDKGGLLQEPSGAMQELCSPLSPMQFNDLYCLSRPEIHTISVGAAHPDDYNEHVAAIELLESSKEQLHSIDRRLREAMREKTGFARPEELWNRLPSWQETPGYINVRYILWLLNVAKGWGLLQYGRRQYQKLGVEVKWVPGNNGEQAKLFDLTNIAGKIDMSNSELVNLLEGAHALFAGNNG